MKKPVIAFVVVVVGGASCSSTDPASRPAGEPRSRSASAIQGGSADITHSFTVAVVQAAGQQISLCSGVLLAPNLVATARHCVSQLTSAQIDCATSRFSATLPARDFLVTQQPAIPMSASGFYSVVANGIVVPPDPNVCGNDIALLILAGNIQVPQYVVPAIRPPMTDHHAYSTAYTAIGYGVDTPTDTMGTSAGTRRIKQNINLSCIPQDTSFFDCFSDPTAQAYMRTNEFQGGDGTCEGDSGSGAYDQGSFNQGRWVAFGVLSRGGVSLEGGACQGGIYSRFDQWATLIADTARQAAALGKYTPPSWAAPPGACRGNGETCGADGDCCSVDCIVSDDSGPASCVACDSANPCNTNYACHQGICIPAAPSFSAPGPTDAAAGDAGTPPPRVTGCALASRGAVALPSSRGSTLFGLAAAAAWMGRRRRAARGRPRRETGRS